MAVVKADGYGHGAVECARRLEKEGIDWFGVALPEEGIKLRQNGISKPILCLGSFWEGQENLLIDYNLTPVVFQHEKAHLFNQTAFSRGTIADIHIKIDTGMGRVGIRFDEVSEFADKLKFFKNLRIAGLMTHFANADNLQDLEFTNLQIQRFSDAVAIFRNKGFHPVYLDMANSPGAIAHPLSRGNLVRLGGVLYGLCGDVLPKEIELPELKPVMSLTTRIAFLKKVPKGETLGYGRTYQTKRDSLIATIPLGYHDGLRRALSNRGMVIVHGKFAPIVGRVSMDWTILDVTDIENVKVGDEVIIIGEQNGVRITAEDLARQAETISYEITCGISQRVRRKYVGSQ